MLEREILIVCITPARTLRKHSANPIEHIIRTLNANTPVEYVAGDISGKSKNAKPVYATAHIRVQLSSYLVQGTFSSLATVKTVYEFIDALLTEESRSRYVLFTMPPKRIYKREVDTLRELGLVPNALLIFESKTQVMPVIKAEILDKFLITF